MKAIFAADPTISRAFDPAGLDQTFTLWTVVPPQGVFHGTHDTVPAQGVFQGIHELVPGHDYLAHSAGRLGDKVALVCGKQRVTYGELEARANAVATDLAASGVARGDRVMIFADNTVETVVSFWAVLKANAVVCIVNPLTKSDKLDYLLNDCLPAALITDAHLHSIFREPARSCPSLLRTIVSGSIDDDELSRLPQAVRWDIAVAASAKPPARRCIDIDLAAIIYTSGSTGEPKGVMLTHRNMLRELFSSARIYSMYGLTECKRCTYLPPEDLARKPLSVGIAIPNTEMWIVDEHVDDQGPHRNLQRADPQFPGFEFLRERREDIDERHVLARSRHRRLDGSA